MAPVSPWQRDEITKRKLTITLPDTKQFAADLMSDLKTEDFRGVAARAILETVGREIAKLMPREFFDVLAEVQKRLGHAPGLLLLTDENYVPWELAHLEQADRDGSRRCIHTSPAPRRCRPDVGQRLG
jgi:hypothetical protein